MLLRILEDFLCVMNTHCSKLCDILEPQCGGPEFNIFPLVTHCALDIICETAMGRSINAQEDSDTPYVRAIYQASDIVFQRQRSVFIVAEIYQLENCRSPWLWDDLLFSFTPAGFRWRKILGTLHNFTKKVIAERKAEYASSESQTGVDDVGMKKRLAFLDLLIEASEVNLKEGNISIFPP